MTPRPPEPPATRPPLVAGDGAALFPVSAARPGAPPPFPGAGGAPGPRTWVIELAEGTQLLTSNHRLHRMALNGRNKDLHKLAAEVAVTQQLPRIGPAHFTFEYRKPVMRHPLADPGDPVFIRDAGALAPMGKVLIDGWVRCGVLAGDTVRYVLSEHYQFADRRAKYGQVVIRITEAGDDR